MKTNHTSLDARLAFLLLLLSILTAQLSAVLAQGTAFTYQGRLNDGANAASGFYDLRFTVYDAAAGGAAVAGPLTNAAVSVSNGLFTVNLNFGAGIFNGAPRWLEIGVRGSGAGDGFTALAPRQALTPTPYSMFAANAGLAGGVTAGAITSAMLANGAVTSNKIAPGAISALDAPDGSPLRALLVNSDGAVGIGGNDSGAALQVAGGGIYRNAANPVFVGAVTNRTGALTNMPLPLDVFVAGNRAYVTSYSPNRGSLSIFDISNPLQPVFLGDAVDDFIRPGSPFTRLEGADSVVVADGVAYVTAQVGNAVTVIDVTNPREPLKLAELVNRTNGITSLDLPTDIILDGANLYVLGFLSSALAVFDVSNPASPQLRAQIFDDSVAPGSPFTKLRLPYRMRLAGNRLYIAARGDHAITILDVSNPVAPQLLAEIVDDIVNPNSPFKRLANVNGVDVAGDLLYAVSGALFGLDSSLTIIDVSSPANPVKVSEVSDDSVVPGSPFTKLGGAWDVKVVDQTAFVTCFLDNAVTAIDVSNPLFPRLIGEFAQGQDGLTTLNFTTGLDVSGTALYVAANSSSAVNLFDLRGTLGVKVDAAVGIGTATPRSALDVVGTIRGSELSVEGAVTAGDVVADRSVRAAGTGDFGTLLSRGRLGIGTNAPFAPLHVVSGEALNTFLDGRSPIGTWLTLGNKAGGTNWHFISTGANNGEGPRKLLISPGGSPTTVSSIGGFVLDPAGRLGLGTIAPTAPLHVVGQNPFPHLRVAAGSNAPYGAFLSLDARDTAGGKEYLVFSTGAGAGEGQGKLVFQNHTDGRTILTLDGSGAVGIGTTAPLDSLLDVEGHVHINDNDLFLRGANDRNHGLGFRASFAGQFLDGPVLYGFTGGALGTTGGGTNWSLRWNNSGQVFTRGAINPPSDRNLKENFTPVDGRDVLEKVAALPIARWNYKAETNTIHLGPVAQDFHAAFGLGTDDKHIATVDADGVALAAIQGLNQKVEEQRAALEQKETEITKLQGEMAELKRLVGALTQEFRSSKGER
jgi:hypothetical protein